MIAVQYDELWSTMIFFRLLEAEFNSAEYLNRSYPIKIKLAREMEKRHSTTRVALSCPTFTLLFELSTHRPKFSTTEHVSLLFLPQNPIERH